MAVPGYGESGDEYGRYGSTYGFFLQYAQWLRWTLYDPYLADRLTFAINPKEATEPKIKKKVSSMVTTAGRNIMHEGARGPQELTFKGVVLNTQQRDDLDAWASKPYQVKLIDEIGDVIWIWIDVFTPTRRRVSSRRYKAEYDVHAFVMDVP